MWCDMSQGAVREGREDGLVGRWAVVCSRHFAVHSPHHRESCCATLVLCVVAAIACCACVLLPQTSKHGWACCDVVRLQ